MRNAAKKSENGFVVLMSTIILSAVMLAVVFSLSTSGFFTRLNLLDSENKEASFALAEACGQIAVLKLHQNSSYTGNETITVEREVCRILAKETSGSEIIIKTKSTIGGAVSNVIINLDSITLAVNRWREAPKF